MSFHAPETLTSPNAAIPLRWKHETWGVGLLTAASGRRGGGVSHPVFASSRYLLSL